MTLDEGWWGPLVLELWCDGIPWLGSELCARLCRDIRRRPPRGELPSACMRCFPGPSHEKASAGIVVFCARLDLSMVLVGLRARAPPGLMRGFGGLARPDLDGVWGQLVGDGVVTGLQSWKKREK